MLKIKQQLSRMSIFRMYVLLKHLKFMGLCICIFFIYLVSPNAITWAYFFLKIKKTVLLSKDIYPAIPGLIYHKHNNHINFLILHMINEFLYNIALILT